MLKRIVCCGIIAAILCIAVCTTAVNGEVLSKKTPVDKDRFELEMSSLVAYGLRDSVPAKTLDTKLVNFPLRTFNNDTVIQDITVREVLDTIYDDVIDGGIKYNVFALVIDDRGVLCHFIEDKPWDKRIQYRYHLYNMKELCNRLAKMKGFGDNYFDNMSFTYLKTRNPVDIFDYRVYSVYVPTEKELMSDNLPPKRNGDSLYAVLKNVPLINNDSR